MAQTITRRGFIGLAGAGMGAALLTACSGGQDATTDTEATSDGADASEAVADTTSTGGIDYMAVVNKQH